LEAARGKEVVWRFKALQNIVILSARLGHFDEMATRYEQLLSFMDQVTRNEANDAINTVLDSATTADVGQLEKMYGLTLGALKSTQNERLGFNISVKLAKLYLEVDNIAKLQKLIAELHKSCQAEDGTDDVANKGSQLVEVYALEIQCCTKVHNVLRLKDIYPKTINLTSAIADPRNIAVIRESGGKMFMSDRKWTDAYNEFFEAFKNYQETGNVRAKAVFKYVILANILSGSSINPFDSREAKVLQDDAEIAAMSNLRRAYEQNDIDTVDSLLSNKKHRILEDDYIAGFIPELLRSIRVQVLRNIVEPYSSISLEIIATRLNVSVTEVTNLLMCLILDNQIDARIDEIAGFLMVNSDDKAATDAKNPRGVVLASAEHAHCHLRAIFGDF